MIFCGQRFLKSQMITQYVNSPTLPQCDLQDNELSVVSMHWSNLEIMLIHTQVSLTKFPGPEYVISLLQAFAGICF